MLFIFSTTGATKGGLLQQLHSRQTYPRIAVRVSLHTETAQQSPVLDKNHHEAFRLQPRMVPVTTTNIAPSVIHCSTVGRTILISGNSCLLSSRESGRGARLEFVLRETCKHITAPVPPRRAIHDNFEWHAVEEALL